MPDKIQSPEKLQAEMLAVLFNKSSGIRPERMP
jgi:hypothetical protein